PVIILGASLLFAILMVITKPSSEVTENREKSWPVSAMKAKAQSISPVITLYARIESPRMAQVKAAINAEVIEVNGKEGEKVEKNSLLVKLDDRNMLLNLKQRQADVKELEAMIENEKRSYQNDLETLKKKKILLNSTNKELNRLKKLKKQNISSQSQLELQREKYERESISYDSHRLKVNNFDGQIQQLEARLEKSKALVGLAEIDLERTEIKAPFSGIISKVTVSPGDLVNNGTPLFSLFDIQALEMRAEIPEKYLKATNIALNSGNPLKAVAKVNGHVIALKLDRLAGEVRKDGGGIDGLFKITDGGEFLRLGQFAEVNLFMPKVEDVFSFPFEALYGFKRMYIVHEGRLKRVDVVKVGETITPEGSKWALIKSDELQEDDTVAVTQLPNAIEGLKVNVVDREK
ncbi:MAG: HlyD family efflux transporter periplasmic adaptor subunit, partial [Nitrospinae bacterium]|nr:HlyD family efflux transporter periplasmic adaptor subunit [Nitrospinota bacterium]